MLTQLSWACWTGTVILFSHKMLQLEVWLTEAELPEWLNVKSGLGFWSGDFLRGKNWLVISWCLLELAKLLKRRGSILQKDKPDHGRGKTRLFVNLVVFILTIVCPFWGVRREGERPRCFMSLRAPSCLDGAPVLRQWCLVRRAVPASQWQC